VACDGVVADIYGMSSVVKKILLQLSTWPLFRDSASAKHDTESRVVRDIHWLY